MLSVLLYLCGYWYMYIHLQICIHYSDGTETMHTMMCMHTQPHTHAHATHKHACICTSNHHTHTYTHTHTHTHTHAHTPPRVCRMETVLFVLRAGRGMTGLWRYSFRLGLQQTCRTRWKTVIICSSVTCSVVTIVHFIIQDGSTALRASSYKGHHKVVELLLGAKANPDLQDKVRTH